MFVEYGLSQLYEIKKAFHAQQNSSEKVNISEPIIPLSFCIWQKQNLLRW